MGESSESTSLLSDPPLECVELISLSLVSLPSYVDQGTAAANNLTYSNFDTFVMRADYEKVVQPGDRGRDSVRIASKKLYNDVSRVSFVFLDLLPS